MAINPNRPIITYENVAVFQSDTPAHSGVSNSGQNLSFLPLVQSINFSTDVERTNVGAIGTKDFIDQSNRSAPDVNFTINTIENFGDLFSGFMDGLRLMDPIINIDRNFYAALGRKRGFDVSGDLLTGIEMLSFGNCFLNNVSISQSIRGLLTSQYTYVGSNMQAEILSSSSAKATGLAPSIDLTGDQSQSIVSRFDEMFSYYTGDASGIIPSYNTNVSISGSGSFGNFLIQSDSIQNFDLNLSINRKTINSLGKKYPVKRKALFPAAGSFNFSNLVSSFELSGSRSNLKDFLSSDEDYFINISGQSIAGDEFDFQIQNAKLISQNQESAIGATATANLGFSFELNNFKKFNLLERFEGASIAYSLRNISSEYTGNVVDVRRSSDNTPQGFTAAQVVDGTLLDFVNAVNIYPATSKSERSGNDFTVTKTDDRNIRVISNLATDGTDDTEYVEILNSSNDIKFGRNQVTFDVKINSGDTTDQMLRLSHTDPFANATESVDIQEGSNTYVIYLTNDNVEQAPKIYFAFHKNSAYDITISNIEVRYFGVDKLDLQAESAGLIGNVSNETSTGFEFDVDNEGSDGYKNLLATANVTAGTYEISFHALLNSGSITGCEIFYYNTEGVGVATTITEGANFLSVTPQVGTNIFFRILGTAVADVSITNITLRQTDADGHVSQWYDQSSNNSHATQSTDDALQPKIVEAGELITRTINGKETPSIKFSADTNMDHGLTSLSSDGQQSLFIVMDNQVTSSTLSTQTYSRPLEIESDTPSAVGNGRNRRPLIFLDDVNQRIFFSMDSFSGLSRLKSESDFLSVYSSITNDTPNPSDATENGTHVARQDGTQFGSEFVTLDNNSTVRSSKRLGRLASNIVGNFFISEIVYYPSDQTTNVVAIETNIKNHYNTN